MAVKLATMILFLMYAATFAARGSEAQSENQAAVTLAGSWSGTWVDSRPGYNGSGGTFTGVVSEKNNECWEGRFALGKSRAFVVELKGKRSAGKVDFDATVDLGKFQGQYAFKASLADDSFAGTYDGPGEKGSFRMKRVETDKAHRSAMP